MIFRKIIHAKSSIAPLVTFRVLFGFIMMVSLIRFAANGWIEELYIEPVYFFTYSWFEWVKPWGSEGMYILFFLMFLGALGILLGWYYRISSALFFLTFTYVELIDKTNYLNHYYFVSLMAFLLIWVPAHRQFSMDIQRGAVSPVSHVPAWCINIFKWQVLLVYCFAGLAKINADWLLEAMPLKLWLPAKSHIPLIGWIFEYGWIPFLFSWFGVLFDLNIGFLLYWKQTRLPAYTAVVVFHLITAALFQIGMFPYIMILSTLIFFSPVWHKNLHQKIVESVGINFTAKPRFLAYKLRNFIPGMLGLFILIQILVPLRHLMYSGPLFWHEQGYRFSWRVMLMEKAGHTNFIIEDDTGKKEWVQNREYLNPQQEKMMSTQPDMILQFARFLSNQYTEKGFENPKVYCNSKVTLNGRPSQTFINPRIDLANLENVGSIYPWVETFDKTLSR